jgi:tight adherence protein B
MKRIVLLLVGAVVVAAPLTSAGAAADGLQLSPGGQATFPHKSLVLSVPAGVVIDPNDLAIRENGQPVHELSVKSVGSSAESDFGTVLAIDASNSMRGEPIRRAIDAAQAFASHRRVSQELGIVTFNRHARTLLAPTTDDDAIEDALAEPPALAKQTHMRDGVMAALNTLRRADVQAGSVVVLSDGADTGSRTATSDLTAAAKARGVRVFTIGLESPRFEETALSDLAETAGGEYTAAPSASELERVYDELGERLAGEYLVRYSSVAGPKNDVLVEATVAGVPGQATLQYRSPKIGAPPQPPVIPEASGFWGSTAAMILVGFGSALLICFAAAWVLIDRRRPPSTEERIAEFVTMGAQDGDHGIKQVGERSDESQRDSLYERLDMGLRGRAWWRRFSVDVEIARIDHKPAQIAVVTTLVTLLTMWLFVTISGATWVALLAAIVPIGVRKFVSHRAAKQRRLFGEQLADNLQVIASAMRSGQSFAGALAVAVTDAPEPAKSEFERVVSDERLGVPLEESLGMVVERMENRDLHQVALVAALQREAGGNSAEVLDRVADTIRDHVALRRLISSLTAQGRLSRWVVSLVPVALVMYMSLAAPDYLDPLLKTTAGNIMLGIAIVMGTTGSLIIKRIVEIKV